MKKRGCVRAFSFCDRERLTSDCHAQHQAPRRLRPFVRSSGHRRRSRRVDRSRPRQGRARRQVVERQRRELVDTSSVIDHDVDLAIVTEKDADGLDIIRHSTSHLLAYAVKELFPDAQVTIGPVIENGFYYDFAYKRPFTPEDLAAIEKRMARDRQARRSR